MVRCGVVGDAVRVGVGVVVEKDWGGGQRVGWAVDWEEMKVLLYLHDRSCRARPTAEDVSSLAFLHLGAHHTWWTLHLRFASGPMISELLVYGCQEWGMDTKELMD